MDVVLVPRLLVTFREKLSINAITLAVFVLGLWLGLSSLSMGSFLLLPHSVSAKMFIALLKAFMVCDILCCHPENTLCINGEMEISRCVHFLFVLSVCIEMFVAGCKQTF